MFLILTRYSYNIIRSQYHQRPRKKTTITKKKCCREQQAMHIHGGGLVTSEQNNQNGWSKTFKVHSLFLLIIKLHLHTLVLTLYNQI